MAGNVYSSTLTPPIIPALPLSSLNPFPTSWSKKKLPLAVQLKNHRNILPQSTPINNLLLLKDLICILQGINGQFIKFSDRSLRDEKFIPGLIRETLTTGAEGNSKGWEKGIEYHGGRIDQPDRDLIHQVAEMGWLFKKINKVINGEEDETLVNDGGYEDGEEKKVRKIGMIEQSLHAALKKELIEYYRLIAMLEGELDNTLDLGQKEEEDEEVEDRKKPTGLRGLTLRRLLVLTEEMRLRLRMMATLVDEAGMVLPDGGLNIGGQLLTSLHSRTSHGDPFIRNFSSHLLTELSVPFFATMSSWIYEGELKDPFNEFFVMYDNEFDDDEGESYEGRGRGEEELWKGKFKFRKEMLPGFLEEAFGRKIFSTGKSLNFMKYSCQDSSWVISRNRSDNHNRVLQYADLPGLERSITQAYSIASQRLFEIFFDKFKLMDHLIALKDYLMLGKGDFVEILMENLGPSLARPANTLYRHNLTSTLETAIRGSTPSSSQTSPLTHLDARMLEFAQGELGWDVFTLEYKVDKPLDTILDEDSMKGYLMIFRHLWRVKRVEFTLNAVWRRLMTGARSFLRVPELSFLFHQTRLVLSEMIFFIKQVQYFCHLEVIACSWQDFVKIILNEKGEGDLDSLINNHKIYLNRLVSKILLKSVATGGRSGKKNGVEPPPMLDQLRNIFSVSLMYQEAADSLCNFALSEAGRKESTRDYDRGLAPTPVFDSRPPAPDALLGIQTRLAEYADEFAKMAKVLVVALAKASDYDLRFLSIRLNFNNHFSGGNKGGDDDATSNAGSTSRHH